MKKIISIVLTIAIMFMTILTGMPAAQAVTAGGLTLSVTANPTSLSGEGSVTFTFAVTNTSSSTINDVNIYLGSGTTPVETIGNVSAEDHKTGTYTRTIKESELGTELTFTAKSGSESLASDTITIAKKTANASLAAKVTASRTTAVKNSDITFTITLENTGEATLSNIEVYLPPLNKGAKVGTVSSLAPTAKKTLTYTFKLTENVTVTPTIKYTANGTTETMTLATKTISISNPDLEITITPDKTSAAAGEDVTFDVLVKNVGNTSFTDVTIYDNQQTKIPAKYSALNPNEKIQAQASLPFDNDTTLKFTVTAKDSTGVVYTFESNSVSIDVLGETQDFAVKMDVTTDTPAIDKAGKVTFKITVTNDSKETFQNAVVTEDIIGTVHTFTTLPQGTKYTEIEYDVTETKTFNFKLTFTDASGKEHTVTSDELIVTVGATNQNPFDNISNSSGTLGPLLIVIAILILLIIGVGATLLILIIKEKKARAVGAGAGGGGNVSKPVKRVSRGPKPPKFKGKNNF